MRLVTSRDNTFSQAVVRKEPPPIRAKKMSAAIRIELATAILSTSDAKYPATLAFSEDFLWEHSFPFAQRGSPDNTRCVGKSDFETPAVDQLFGFCS
jgi:hypothetical protein